MSRTCQAECSFCCSKFGIRRHGHTEGWSPAIVAFVEEESGLKVGNKNLCVCDACRLSIRHAMKAKANNESYQQA